MIGVHAVAGRANDYLVPAGLFVVMEFVPGVVEPPAGGFIEFVGAGGFSLVVLLLQPASVSDASAIMARIAIFVFMIFMVFIGLMS
jgi:hypothetical protein